MCPFCYLTISINHISPKAFFYASSATRRIVRMPYPPSMRGYYRLITTIPTTKEDINKPSILFHLKVKANYTHT